MDPNKTPSNIDLNVRLPKIIDDMAISFDSIDIGQMVKRTERISSALYLITGFFPEGDPLTFKIREVSVNLLSLMSHFIFESRREIIGRAKEANRTVVELVSLLDTSRLAGFISEMNFNILSDEIEKVVTVLASISSSVNEAGSLIGRDFFKIPESPTRVSNESHSTVASKSKNISSNITSSKTVNRPVNSRIIEGIGSVDVKRKSRRESILSVVKKQGEVGIKEISNTVKNCSEKTIQRELISLVLEGVLKKRGERRWSMYSLA